MTACVPLLIVVAAFFAVGASASGQSEPAGRKLAFLVGVASAT
jgi:hypothetical protein